MKTSNNGIKLMHHFEGCELEAYVDSAGVITIGRGHTRTAKMGMVITQERADELFKEDLIDTENQVNALNLNIDQNQFDALVSLVYNIGIGNFKSSTLLKLIKEYADNSLIVNEFLKWRKAGGKVLKGLERRRKAEVTLYFTGKGIEE